MSDMRSMDRESKKRQLRSNIVSLPNQNRPGSYEEEDSEEVIRQYQSGKRKKQMMILLFLAFFVAIVAFCFYRYQKEYEYTEYEVTWEQAMRYVDPSTVQSEGVEAGEESGVEAGATNKNVGV